MTPQSKLLLRSIILVIVAFLVTWATFDYSFEKGAIAAAITAALQAAIELLGPTSDAGIKWSSPTKPGG